MTGGVATLFRVAGIPVRIHVSWLVVFGLLAWSLSVGYFPHVLPDVARATYWLAGLVASLLLFVSVFLHELSHSVIARRNGLRVSAITLHIFGGVSQLEEEPASPGTEFRMAIVGPLTSFALGGIAALGARAVSPGSPAAAVLGYLAFVNVVVGAFNLVPGFPLDGGRVLRAALWHMRGDLRRATETASRAGVAVAFLIMALGVLRGFGGDFLGGLWFVLIGVFLRQAAQTSYQRLQIRGALEPLAVRDVMTRTVVHVPPDIPVERAVDEFVWRHHVASFPVVGRDGVVVGIFTLRQLATLPRERWTEALVREVMQPIGAEFTTTPSDDVWDAFQKLSRNGLGRLVVVDGRRVVGYLSANDVMHVLTVATAGRRDGSRIEAA
jgi:Zn-dependent protease/predicted transcriptional regulator